MLILDCCTGTADLALAYDRAAGGKSRIVATDFCREMLGWGAKGRKAGASSRITLIESDAQRLPLPSDTFGIVSVAFGLRNVGDTIRGVDELIRVARPGGKVAILEFSRPRGPCWAGCTSRFSAMCCHASARQSPPTPTTHTITCREACWLSRTARRCSTCWPQRGIDRAEAASAHPRNRHALRRDQAQPCSLTSDKEHHAMNSVGLVPLSTWWSP